MDCRVHRRIDDVVCLLVWLCAPGTAGSPPAMDTKTQREAVQLCVLALQVLGA